MRHAPGRERIRVQAGRNAPGGMMLASPSGGSLELVLVRYEHPDIAEGLWESNWLVVSGCVSNGTRSWRFTESCVTTFELADLADWLESLAAGEQEAGTYKFAEPNLAFHYARRPSPVLTVHFRAGSAPDWVEPTARQDGVSVGFQLEIGDLRAAAAELRNALIEFPIRGGAA